MNVRAQHSGVLPMKRHGSVPIWQRVPFSPLLWVWVIVGVCSSSVQAQTTDTIYGSDINTYMEATGFDICEQYVTGDTTGTNLTVGDRILIMQMKGCWIDTTSSYQYGQISTFGACGAYEFNTITSIDEEVGNPGHFLIYFEAPPCNLYEAGQGKRLQVIRVPQYENVVVDTSGGNPLLSPPSWNGSKYGVLVFEASGWVEILAPINADGDGFEGGAKSLEGNHINELERAYVDGEKGGEKGEGAFEVAQILVITNKDPVHGLGAYANGAGGGNGLNAGGGGGGSAGRGGQGGYQVSDTTMLDIGGRGGWGYNYNDNTIIRAFFGGGGGGGQRDDDSDGNNADIGNGAAGGGIIIIRAAELYSNGAGISAVGSIGDTSSYDGAGGGGGGGVILLDIDTIYMPSDSLPLSLSVKGGDGGNSNGTSLLCHGPGGGGGGGYIGLSGLSRWVTTDSVVSVSINGGSAGVSVGCTAVSDSTYGAIDGYNGTVRYEIVLPGYFP